MDKQYDPRNDKEAPMYEKDWFDFFDCCERTRQYEAGLSALKLERKDLPKYIIDRFEKSFREGALENKFKPVIPEIKSKRKGK